MEPFRHSKHEWGNERSRRRIRHDHRRELDGTQRIGSEYDEEDEDDEALNERKPERQRHLGRHGLRRESHSGNASEPPESDVDEREQPDRRRGE